MIITFLGYIIMAGFFVFESQLRKGQEAKSLKSGQFDQRSTMFIGIAYFICATALLSSPLLPRLKIALLPVWVGWLGIAVALMGFGLRGWSMATLGRFYTRTLKVAEDQSIVQAGPYHLIRHPGYLGSILIWCGVAASTQNWIVFLIVLIVMFSVYIYRIQNEEKMLLTKNAEYAEYQKHTWRLIPFLY